MRFADSMKKLIGLEEIDDDETITKEEIDAAKEKIAGDKPSSYSAGAAARNKGGTAGKSSEKYFASSNPGTFKMVLIVPKSFDECPKLVDSLKGRRPVIINLETVETDEARKIFDFMNGATYALNGSVQKVANNIFIFAPENVDVSTGDDDRTSYDFGSGENITWR